MYIVLFYINFNFIYWSFIDIFQPNFYSFNINSFVLYGDSTIGGSQYTTITIDSSVTSCSSGVYSVTSSTSCYYCAPGYLFIFLN